MRRVRAIVTGRVQGVGFRAATVKVAGRLGIVGSVRNRDDGSVALDVEGPDDKVAELLAWCKEGPPMAHVTGLEVEELAPTGKETEFAMSRERKPAETIVEQNEVPGMTGLIVLGCLERRVTLYSQQIRALNLIWGLHGVGRIAASGTRIAVVGAGAAGLTAAAAAAHLGANVKVFERTDAPMHLQAGCSTRWLHPRVYDWPLSGWNTPDAGLPLLNWREGDAATVAAELVQGFDRIVERTSSLSLHTGVRNLEVSRRGDHWRVLCFDGKTNFDEPFDLVILAVGFGVERDVPFAPRLSYWRVDTLDQTPLDAEDGQLTYLVSGTGDGGLIDVLRSHQRAFSHRQIIQDYLDGAGMNKIEKKLLAIEKRAHEMTRDGDARDAEMSANAFLTDEYSKLEAPMVDKTLAARARRSVRVILVGQTIHPISVRTAIHNRFLISRLLYGKSANHHGVEYRVGTVRRVESDGFRFRAELSATSQASLGRVQVIPADRVVIRHGAASPLERFFPEVLKRLEDRKLLLDPAMPKQLWQGDFWKPRLEESPSRRAPVRHPKGRPAKHVHLVATFEMDGNVPRGFFTYDVDQYWIHLTVENAPAETSSITYHLDESYTPPHRQALNAPTFDTKITAYGDYC